MTIPSFPIRNYIKKLAKSQEICYNLDQKGDYYTMPEYYDGTKLLSMLDINGNKPELYLCTTNRTGGKTTFFRRREINLFKKKHIKFCEIFRYNYELTDISDKIFKDISGLFFPHDNMRSVTRSKGVYQELFLNDMPCGYAIALNQADQIKKLSHLFSDVGHMFFDEFQSETNNYCTNEIQKLLSVHTSIARGQGKQTRYVPVVMCGNAVSLINPYFVELGIAQRLRDDTKFLRGDGYVMEQGWIQSAADALKDSGFNRAFSRNKYVAYSAENVYLNDSRSFLEKPTGKGRYLATLRYNGCDYGIREYAEEGIIYCNDIADKTDPNKITVTTADHEINYVMLKRNDFFLNNLRYYFEQGCFRFKDLKCKDAVLKALSY